MEKLVLAAVVLSLLFLGSLIDWHWFVCDVGHYETVHVPEYQQSYIMWVGKVPITQYYTVYAHDEQRWVCDHNKGDKK